MVAALQKTVNKVQFIGNFSSSADEENLEVYGILPNIKNPRWIIPLENRDLVISSLALYQPSLMRAKLIKQMSIILAKANLFKLLVKDRIFFKKSDELLRSIYSINKLSYAIFMGTAGSHQKVTVQVMDEEGIILGYIKISDNEDIDKLLKNEAEILGDLSRFEIKNGLFPKVIYLGNVNGTNILVLDSLKSKDSKFSSRLSHSHINFLSEIFMKTSKAMKFNESEFMVQLKNRIKNCKGNIPDIWTLRFEKIFDHLKKNMGNISLPFGLCHRDFTPWNTFFHDDKLYVFDWEYAKREYPPLLDIFHFIIQDGIIVRKLNPEALVRRVFKNKKYIDQYINSLGIRTTLLRPMLLCYLMDIVLLYIEREAGIVSPEIKYSLSTWLDMADLIVTKNVV